MYGDIGEVFPCLSQRGQETSLHKLLKFVHWSKSWRVRMGITSRNLLLAQNQPQEVTETVKAIHYASYAYPHR